MSPQQRKQPSKPTSNRAERERSEAVVRIIGGQLRGRKLLYSGEMRTRPMKDRVREALFNLVGPQVKGIHAIDLFSGTGALGIEAVSRGAAGATLIERHFPTAQLIRRNVEDLAITDRCEVVAADAFTWLRRNAPGPAGPWLVLCSPPFEFYESRLAEMTDLMAAFVESAPSGSILVVESPETLDPATLPDADRWQTRTYAPVNLSILRKA